MIQELVIQDNKFELNRLNKYGTLMTLGNGYMGIRGVHEESYPEQKRGMYVAGVYNKATESEPDELVNLPDLIGVNLEIDNEVFSLMSGKIISYDRKLHLDRGEITKNIVWENEEGTKLKLKFQRMVAKHDLHVLASKLTIISLNKDITVKVVTGIDAQQTNFGRQHLIENHVRVQQETFMQGMYETTHSNHCIGLFTACKYSEKSDRNFVSKNRQIQSHSSIYLKQNQEYTIEKYGAVFTSLDETISSKEQLEVVGLKKIEEVYQLGYDLLLEKSIHAWNDFWNNHRVTIQSENKMDQTAIDFALYHIEIMTPKHSSNFSVAAKGLTGEGYKGHVFWDTEIFILPYYLYTNPDIAKQLLQYRYNRLPQAVEKAKANNYQGALFPWESAYTGEEETPTFAAINIKTGKRQKVASALAEHHIVADIAYAVTRYFEITGDDTFMLQEGLEILKETSEFWISRTTDRNGNLYIDNVIGPDEYTEFVDNNAYTNYMAYHNVEKTLSYMEQFGSNDLELKARGEDFLNRLYLPKENVEKIIPQDDTFLDKPVINLDKYKENQGSQSILLDYSREEVNEMQILKQADVVMLLYLFPELFSDDVMFRNLRYYEERTIHDSSLSKAIHSIVSMRCGESDLAYKLFKEACLIDLGSNPHSSDEGIHAASLGSIWLAVFGFVNITFESEKLKVNPKIPTEWTYLRFPMHYKGRKLEIIQDKNKLIVHLLEGDPILIEVNNQDYNLLDSVVVEL